MSLQIIVVYVIGILLAAYLVYRIYRVFFNKEYRHVCRGCPAGKECNKSKVIRDGCHKNGRLAD